MRSFIIMIVVTIAVSVLTSTSVYMFLRNTEKVEEVEAQPESTQSEIQSSPNDGKVIESLASRLYLKNKQGRFKSDEHTAFLVISCDDNDLLISGTCMAAPYSGGDTVTIGGSMLASKKPYTLVDSFSCQGSEYHLTGDYSVNANIICLKRD